MDRQLNICLITANFWPAWGGAEGQCRLLARELHRRNHKVVILTRGWDGAPGEAVVDGVRVRRIPSLGPRYLRSALWTLAAASWLRRQGREFDILQGYQLLSPAHAAILGRHRGARQPIVVRPACSGVDGDVAEVRRLPLTSVRRRMLRRVDAFVTLSGAIEAELAEFGLGAVPCHRIPNGVDRDVFRPATPTERQTLRAALGLPQDRILCAFVGRLVRQKNPEVLLDIWRGSAPQDAHLVLVGDGPLRPRLQARIAADASGDRVTVVGPTPDTASYVRASDLFLLPSRAEGMPNALIEAMACGIPIVATDVPGSREVLGDRGDAGWLVPAGDPVALAEAIGRLVAAPAMRREMGVRARSAALERHDVHRVVQRYLSTYAELLG
jgi:glycosyltransferase involved in cell wall biosynthesis